MTERLLQYIWQFQHFNRSSLTTDEGEPLEIIFPGQFNANQGPDFLEGRVRHGKTVLAGSIELHLRSSQWFDHGHDADRNYTNVILHVVYEHDGGGPPGIPVLELRSRISHLLLGHYQALMEKAGFIPCEAQIHSVRPLTWTAWKSRLVAERLTRKAKTVFLFLDETKHHWEETFWWILARNFGIRVNVEAFEAMARSLPLKILARHKSSIHQLEAFLLGQAGLLEQDFTEHYPRMLQREYRFLRSKYALKPIHVPVHFLRMRPGNFPSIRLAQLAMLLHSSTHLFASVLESESILSVKSSLSVVANDYWNEHYRLDEPSPFSKKQLGEATINNILINSMAPMLFAYGMYHQDEGIKTKAIRWLEEIATESNAITKGFASIGLAGKSAFDSQACIELESQYCKVRRCLECSIGVALLKGL
jgi:Protein of unknown function (DUF2851)